MAFSPRDRRWKNRAVTNLYRSQKYGRLMNIVVDEICIVLRVGCIGGIGMGKALIGMLIADQGCGQLHTVFQHHPLS